MSLTATDGAVDYDDPAAPPNFPADNEPLLDNVAAARQRLASRVEDPATPLELKRQSLLSRMVTLQNEIVLSSPDGSGIAAQLMPLLLDRTARIYEAATEEELRVVGQIINQVDSRLQDYRAEERARTLAGRLLIGLAAGTVGLIGLLVYWGTQPGGVSASTLTPILDLPLPVLLWGLVGSVVAMLYRSSQGGDRELSNPLRWLVTRPAIGITIAMLACFLVRSTVVPFLPEGRSIPGEVLWLIAFLAATSDRLIGRLLHLLVGGFGGRHQKNP